MENKTGKYFKYAIGEILLVVIGILIALSINNWNQNRIKKAQLENTYQVIEDDLKTDLQNIAESITFYENLENNLDEILASHYTNEFSDTINENNFPDCMPCTSHIGFFFPFNTQNKGLELLKNFEKGGSLEADNLSQEIIQFYTKSVPQLATFIDFIAEEALNNLKYYEQFPWYEDYMFKRYNPEAVVFFTQNQTYRNRVVTFRNITIQNYLKILKEYREQATEIINKIEERKNTTH